MANEPEEPGDFHLKNLLGIESSSNAEGASLESTHSESESASSVVTQIEAISSSSKVIEASASIQNEIKPNDFVDAKDDGNQSSSASRIPHISIGSSSSSSNIPRVNYGMESGDEDEKIQQEINSTVTTTATGTTPTVKPFFHDANKKSPSDSFEGDEEEEEPQERDGDEHKDLDQSYDDDTISSEAVVDDIELILMPETAQDMSDLSPQLVRVTELKRPVVNYDTDVFDDDDDGRSEQESDFQKFGTDDEEAPSERSDRSKLRRRVLLSSLGGGDEDNEQLSSRDYLGQKDGNGRKSSGKVNSGVQTDITALETCSNNPFEYKSRRKSVGKSSTKVAGLGLSMTSSKRLNWKSELTLLPSKTKIRTTGFSGYESMNYQDQYSPRVAKFTSQDTLSSQFMKPTMLYRTRNLSRNLNQCESSESTLALPAAGLSSTSDSARYHRDRISSSTSSNFKECYSTVSSTIARRQPLTSGQAVTFRSSLPDLSSQPDNKGHRRSFKSMKNNKSYRLTKKSSSDDDTSSLIDESERCLRSSIDLLLTDDLGSPGGADLSCRSTGLRGGGGVTESFGYYSSRRSHSQPVLIDDGDCGDLLRSVTMGSPFLPRKLSDMRCSRWAKMILPNGHVAVVAVKEMDELRDSLTVHTDTGCSLNLPFRKVVFAWKSQYTS